MFEKQLIKLLNKTYFWIKRKNLNFSKELTLWEVFLFFYNKGFMQLIRGMFLIPFIHSKGQVFIGKSVQIKFKHKLYVGKNCYIGDYSQIDCLSKGGVFLGNNVTLREFAWIQLTSNLSNPGEKIFIGDHTYIGPYSKLGAAAPISIGKYCQIGANVSFIAENHEYTGKGKIFDQLVSRKGITVGDDCWIGNNVIILDGVSVGNGCVIGAGAVVTKSLPDYVVAVGMPAKVIKQREVIN